MSNKEASIDIFLMKNLPSKKRVLLRRTKTSLWRIDSRRGEDKILESKLPPLHPQIHLPDPILFLPFLITPLPLFISYPSIKSYIKRIDVDTRNSTTIWTLVPTRAIFAGRRSLFIVVASSRWSMLLFACCGRFSLKIIKAAGTYHTRTHSCVVSLTTACRLMRTLLLCLEYSNLKRWLTSIERVDRWTSRKYSSV